LAPDLMRPALHSIMIIKVYLGGDLISLTSLSIYIIANFLFSVKHFFKIFFLVAVGTSTTYGLISLAPHWLPTLCALLYTVL